MLKYEFIDPDNQINSTEFQFIESFLKATNRMQTGWHYITDITWIYSQIKSWPTGFKILDAGGGVGPVQFLMAELGFDVTNIDLNLNKPSFSYQKRYKCTYEILPSFKSTDYKDFLDGLDIKRQFLETVVKDTIKKSMPYQMWSAKQYIKKHEQWERAISLETTRKGQVKWLKGNLCNMPEVQDSTFDAVVSLSAIEHIPLEALKKSLREIKRVLKPDARWAVTTSATEQSKTCYHEPSQSNCFSSSDIEKIFEAIPKGEQNSLEILHKYRNNKYLRENLARFYYKSGRYGMPWGKWDPKYIPVGIFI